MSKDKGPVLKMGKHKDGMISVSPVYQPIINGLKIPLQFPQLKPILHFIEFMRQWRIRYKLDPILMKKSKEEAN